MAQLPVPPAKAGNSAEAAASQVIAKAQTEDANLSNAQLVLAKMSTLVQQAGDSATSATDRDAINQELSSLKGEFKTISGGTSSDALSRSYDGGNGASYSLVGAAGSREISVSATTTAKDYAGMLTALNGARDGVSAAQASNSVTMTTAFKGHTDSLVSSAKSSGLDVHELTQDASEVFLSATAARNAMLASRLPIGNANMSIIQAALLRG